ncbi:TetR/AcrR family transcriptional regulator (plasmid) [Rhizobium sp. CB3060]|jgi:TetR/AcrR family transcriptional regulator, transcriptional repressor for nem operon|uniref:TetR/AcrR family transcriptional regulator n=1 Tax=Rhizobium sp. CB3060 TaxID=3138255 RepID=UPI0021A48E24|nr:TetR/AcrR family transcriptional regulator [Rhizobium tropici]UWU25580.1 TetR/AcrR family transcriptional regulator [Rhizobium tropici]
MANRATREQIVGVADDLFYRRGFDHTSFADIAELVKISRGNFYHHFKTKDDILEAVIQKRLADRNAMLERWEIEGKTPVERISSFIDILIVNGDKIKLYGCPIGTLTSELAKLNHPAQPDAGRLFMLFRTWLRRQFVTLGREADADVLAMHLLSRSQGAATLFNAFQDQDFAQREVDQMKDWLKDIAAEASKPTGDKLPRTKPLDAS